MKAVIMAGGEGSRLRPLTCCKPKPLAPVIGKPALEHIILLLKTHGITEIAVTLQYLPKTIMDWLGDGARFGVHVRYFMEAQPLGTAGSVKNTNGFVDETCVVISGDAVCDIDLSQAAARHRQKKALATLVLKQVDTPLDYGVVVTNGEGRVTRFLEKPSWSEVFSDTVNTGIYIIEPEALQSVPAGEVFDFSKDLFPKLMHTQDGLYGYVTDSYWCDIGSISAYKTCQFEILQGKTQIVPEAEEIREGVWIEPGVTLEKQVTLRPPVYIGSGSVIHAGAQIGPYTCIGKDCVLETGAAAVHSVLWDGCRLMAGSSAYDAVLCDGVVLKPYSAVQQDSAIGARSIVGENSIVRPGIKIWNHKMVLEDSIVSQNVIWGDSNAKIEFGESGIRGNVSVELTPEVAAKIGSAFAAACGSGKIAVSSDEEYASIMLKHALTAGLVAGGVQVVEFGKQPIPITRAGIRFYGFRGGMHVMKAPGGQTEIRIMDETGADLMREGERKLENMLAREDFGRGSAQDMKEVLSLASYRSYYIRDIVSSLRNAKLGFNLLVHTETGLAKSILTSVLNEVSCDYKLSGTPGRGEAEELEKLRSGMQSGNYDFGAYIDSSGERLTLVCKDGTTLNRSQFLMLTAYILMKSHKGTEYIAALDHSKWVEEMAKNLDGQVVWTKTSPLEVMSGLVREGGGESLCEQFVLEFDAVGGLVKLLDFLKEEDCSLQQVLQRIPTAYFGRRECSCKNRSKGHIMRHLMQQHEGRQMEMEEGVKIYEDGGWVLVLPHKHKPLLRIISEGMNQEFAEELAQKYQRELDGWSEI